MYQINQEKEREWTRTIMPNKFDHAEAKEFVLNMQKIVSSDSRPEACSNHTAWEPNDRPPTNIYL
jgi:NADH:ubiquinone oxidoreductase subunit